MNLEIVPELDLSLDDLIAKERAGYSVIKTPHVGNVYPNNLAIASLGIPLVLVDQTYGAKDKNFHPHQVIVHGQAETVAPLERLVSHARVYVPSMRFPERFSVGTYLSQAHVTALREAIPVARVETVSDRTRREQAILLPMLEVLTRHVPHAWQRRVDGEGHIYPANAKTWADIQRWGVHGASPDGSGWIIPNAWHILSDAVIAIHKSGQNMMYSLSGPDMIRYYPKVSTEINQGYQYLHAIWPQLPMEARIKIVPVAEMRFVTVQSRAHQLDRLLEVYQSFVRAKREDAERIQGLEGAARHAAIEDVKQRRGRDVDALRACVQSLPELFYRLEEANWLTQYDLLLGERLYVPAQATRMTMREVQAAMTLFQRLRA